MPGITGIISRLPAAHCGRTVQTMTAAMCHEPFHTAGHFAAPDLGVHAGWVAHAGTLAATQVFENEAKDIALIWCGEVFSEPEVKAQLRRDGHQFSETGGAWLVHLYEARGEKFFEELNGLFSGLLIDRRQKKVFLFNDRYGMERIYWHETPDAFYFATEAKALLRVLPELRAFDADGVAQMFGVGCTMGWRTLFRGISLLPGGARWTFADGACRRENYFTPAGWEALPALSSEEYEAQFAATFKKILPQYFDAPMPIGMALTGGFDTRMILACRPANLAVKPVAYTFTGVGRPTEDDRIAALVATACGMSHQVMPLRKDFFTGFGDEVDRTVFITDGVWGTGGAHEIYFHRFARELSRFRLTGNYGSEVFRGISTFKPIGLRPEIFQPTYAAAAAAAASQLDGHRTKHPGTFAIFKEVPWNLFGSVAAGRSQLTFRTPFLDNALVKLAYQAPPHLRRSSMPAARLIAANDRALNAIPTDRGYFGKNSGPLFLWRRAWAEVTFKMDYHYSEGLPKKLFRLNAPFRFFMAQTGLGGCHKFLPYSTWFRRELQPMLRERLAAAAARLGGYFDARQLDGMAAQHASGRVNLTPEINAVLNLESIERQLFKNLPGGNAPD